MNNKTNKKFFLISFLPAVAYWYLEANYSVHIALLGGGILAIIELLLEKIFTKHIHKISVFNFLLIVVLGGFSYFFNDGVWFKLQPSFTGVFMGAYFIFNGVKKESLFLDTMKEMNHKNIPPKEVLLFMERNLGFFLFFYGVFMYFIAEYSSTSTWLFYKTAGFYILTLVFFVLLMLYLKFFKLRENK